MEEKAFMLIREFFEGKKDKGGNPYSHHLFSVYEKVKRYGMDVAISALLHDVLEDTELTIEDLIDREFSNSVVEVIDILTRKVDETYREYVDRVIESNSHAALIIKRADLEDNMDISRLKIIGEKDIMRLKKRYIPAWILINKKIEELERANV